MTNPYGSPSQNDDETFELDDGLDLNDVSSAFYVAPGAYEVEVVDIVAEDSNAGKPMWTWTLSVKGTSQYAGKELKVWTSLQANALFKLQEITLATGIWVEGTKLSFKRSDAIGAKAIANVEDRQYKGKTVSSVESMEPLT